MSPLPADLGDGAVLRRLTHGDLRAIWQLVQTERERLAPWMPWVEGTKTIDDERTWLVRVLAEERGLEGCGLFVDGAYAGGIGLMIDPFGFVGEIGYWIDSSHEGKGYVTRSAVALIDIGFGELGLHRIVIRAGVENARSRAIPERLGFTREGVARGEGKGSNGYYDLVVYGLLEDEWKGR